MQKGCFITLEGGEGTGKSTQITRLAETLKRANIEHHTTREPGGAPGAEEIRALLVSGDADRWAPLTEVLLHTAARAEHITKTVTPKLAAGTWVLCDRFSDSTLAYQGYGHGVDLGLIRKLHHDAFGDFQPDLTLVLDLPVELGLARADTEGANGNTEDRYERMGGAFHERLREGFLAIAKAEPERCTVIDASGSEDEVASAIAAVVAERLGVSL